MDTGVHGHTWSSPSPCPALVLETKREHCIQILLNFHTSIQAKRHMHALEAYPYKDPATDMNWTELFHPEKEGIVQN